MSNTDTIKDLAILKELEDIIKERKSLSDVEGIIHKRRTELVKTLFTNIKK